MSILHISKVLVFSLVAGACGGAVKPEPAIPVVARHAAGPQIKLASVYVDDQAKALRFYTEVVGFAKKDDVSNGGYRWLTVSSPADPDGAALLLAANADPVAKAYQEHLVQQSQPAVMLFTDDVARDYARIKARGAEFTMPPTPVTGSIITMMKDTCGNLVQLTQLVR